MFAIKYFHNSTYLAANLGGKVGRGGIAIGSGVFFMILVGITSGQAQKSFAIRHTLQNNESHDINDYFST